MTDNPQAFPQSAPTFGLSGDMGFPQDGMTLRDWFAGQALCGIAGCFQDVAKRGRENSAQARARWSYEQADAMLAARGAA